MLDYNSIFCICTVFYLMFVGVLSNNVNQVIIALVNKISWFDLHCIIEANIYELYIYFFLLFIW